MLDPPLRVGVAQEFPLWADIGASESFPAGVTSAFYTLTLEAPVGSASEVRQVEDALISALRLLALSWSFSGGAMLVLDDRVVLDTPRFVSNAADVRNRLATSDPAKMVSARSQSAYESLAGYRAPPLALAAEIARCAHSDFALDQLLRYYHSAWVSYFAQPRGERISWFVNLYKVRDLLSKLHGGDRKVCTDLQIPQADWSTFGRALNQGDLRHASAVAVAQLSDYAVQNLYAMARSWTAAHLTTRGLTVL